MTEAEWHTCTDPVHMLDWLIHRSHPDIPSFKTPSERKLRLFAEACRYHFYYAWMGERWSGWESDDGMRSRRRDEGSGAAKAARGWAAEMSQKSLRAALLRDIAGNPFKPIPIARYECPICKDDSQFRASGMCRNCGGEGDIFSPWLTRTVRALAETICREQDFSLMDVLADAMEESGCTDEAILEHLRSSASHARGCHVLDLLLGRE